MLHVANINIIRRPRSRTNGRQTQDSNQITRHPVVLVHALCVLDAAVQLGHIVLGEADKGLEVDGNVEGEAEAGVGRGKVLVAGALLVDFDNDEAGG